MKQTENKNLTDISVILPVHEVDEITKQLFLNSVKSVEGQKVRPDELLIVVPTNSEASNYVKSVDYGEIKDIVTILENDGPTDFASQTNFGVSNAKSEWVSLLEYDDEYANTWFKNVLEYREAYPNVGLFMPIIVDVDSKGLFVGFTNEAVWATSFSDEIGILDLNALLAYQNFNIDGIVIKKSYFDEYGGFKPSIKLTFIYEFLLRMAFKDVRIMTIPKFGYKHINQRENSLFANYKDSINPVEARWWLSQAKKEYYFDKDRKITYDKSIV
jgi:GT2 family glycosyltransferase